MNPLVRFLTCFVTELSCVVLHLQTYKKPFLWTKKTVLFYVMTLPYTSALVRMGILKKLQYRKIQYNIEKRGFLA